MPLPVMKQTWTTPSTHEIFNTLEKYSLVHWVPWRNIFFFPRWRTVQGKVFPISNSKPTHMRTRSPLCLDSKSPKADSALPYPRIRCYGWTSASAILLSPSSNLSCFWCLVNKLRLGISLGQRHAPLTAQWYSRKIGTIHPLCLRDR